MPNLGPAIRTCFTRTTTLSWGAYAVALLIAPPIQAQTSRSDQQAWNTTRVHELFHCEGASAGDLNGDGNIDIVEGPLWYAGPDFKTTHELAAAKSFPKAAYSDQFFSHVADVDADGDHDVLVVGFPGAPARLYVNPGKDALNGHWPMFEITGPVDNESPAIVDLIPGGAPEIVCGSESQYGYFSAGDDATTAWNWTPISRPGACPNRFVHSMGVGDVNGDGRLDILDRTSWWEMPAPEEQVETWTQHQWAPEPYGGGGAQICVGDVDQDGDNDIVTSFNAHGYGLAWFEQRTDGTFARHDIMGQSSLDNPYGIVFSQLHAVALVDIDGDGAKDIVTGRRHWAHGGHDPGGLQDPVLYWFRNTRADGNVDFVPHLIDDDSGVGVDVLVVDLNQDNRPDVVSASKRGLSIHMQIDATADGGSDKWRVSEGRDQSKYAEGFSPDEAAKNMLVPDGFEVDLIAAEPALTQPIAMCFDARGRIWVIEGHTYPTKAPAGEGKDRILIFEDADANGSFEKQTVFAEGLNLASGIEIGFGGVFVGAAPELLFIPDQDQDDRPDSEPVVLLDGWGYQDTHETLNSFTWGPDGWLYGVHGVFTHSRVGAPGTPDDQRTPLNAGVWRYHPTRKQFEVYAHGTSNPWGVDFNDRGDWFISACVIPHLYHMVQGGRYQRQGGQHFNRYTYDDIKTIADHAHYTGNIRDHAFWGENSVTRPASALDTSMLGGGHAHCGLAIYNGDAFPAKYDGSLLFHNLHGHRVVREAVEREGSGYIGRHRPDFALSQDHHQIGVGIMVGPDGALYTSDWHDPQTCHNRDQEIWNRTDGRMFRIRYGVAHPYQFNLWRESDAQLIERIKTGNGFFARQSARLLQERAAAGKLDLQASAAALKQALVQANSTKVRLRALWAAHTIGGLQEDDYRKLLHHSDPYVRGWTVQLIGEPQQQLPPAMHQALVDLATGEHDLVVVRYLASLLQRLPVAQRLAIATPLAANRLAAGDHNIPLLVWYGIEPLVPDQPTEVLSLALSSPLPNLSRFVVRRMAESPTGRAVVIDRINQDQALQGNPVMVLEELLAAAQARSGVAMPDGWPTAFSTFQKSENPRVQELSRSVAVQFGDSAVLPYFRARLHDPKQPQPQRLAAIDALRTAKDPELTSQLHDLLGDTSLAAVAATTLAQVGNADTPHVLLSHFKDLPATAKTNALATLVSRKNYADAFISAMESGQIAPESVPAFIIRQAVALDDKGLNQRLEKTWGKISISSAEMKQQYAKYNEMLTPNAIQAADASRGRALFDANCGNCHKLFGSGGEIGPDITGANRSSVKYWLENILEPNALIGKAYQVTTVLTADGRVVSGIIKDENEDAVTVQTATEKLVISKDDIDQMQPSEVSLMPTGQLQPMADQQVRDLIKYLMSPSQVAAEKP